MDRLLARRSGATSIASAPPKSGGLMSAFQPITNGSNFMNSWSLFSACAAGEAFLLYAILIAHTLTPVTALLIGQDSARQGAAARYQEIFNWNGLIPTVMRSIFLAVAVWSAFQLTARALPKASVKPLRTALPDTTPSGVINLSERAALATL
jgi:hypothetical protein